VACDHYHRMPEDVQMMQGLGLQSYRFSISWSRVLPQGYGRINPKGLDFYDRLVDNLLAANIIPNATLYHWDLPQALQDKGGWPNRDSCNWFVEYARIMFDTLGDRVPMWATFNEPQIICSGYGSGGAPRANDQSQVYQTAHHLLLAHGQTVQLFRQGGYQGDIGIVLNINHFIPASESQADRDACQRADASDVTLFLDPLFKGHYPERLMEWLGSHAPSIQSGDLDVIMQPIDFLGVNYYLTFTVQHDQSGSLFNIKNESISAPGFGRTILDWGINPEGLTAVLLRLKNEYGNPTIYITENGCALPDTADAEGFVNDWERVEFLRCHFLAAHDAIQKGVNVKGYYVWSLMDNFEWTMGYKPRFGLVRVEYETGKRIPKQSAFWYQDVIAQNGIEEQS